MNIVKLKGLLYLCCLWMMPVLVSAQKTASESRVDTLSWKERLTFRTNMVDWTLLVPNIGVEYDIRKENWNRWTVGLNLRGNWQTHHTFKPGLVYNIRGVRAEFRNYWRPREINETFPAHTGYLDRLFSCRRKKVKHPGVVFYRGAYVSFNDFSIKLTSKGYQGQAYTFGFTYGMVKPLYVFNNGSSLDLELGISAGISYARYDEYRHDRESNCYPVTKQGDPKVVLPPTVSDVRVGFVYRIGKYPLAKKYHWRYDVDQIYRELQESIADSLDRVRRDNKLLDSLTNDARNTFWHVYDSVYSIKKHERDSINDIKAKNDAMEKQRLAEAKERERQAKADAKAAEKQAKAAAKDSIGTAPAGVNPAADDSTAVPAAPGADSTAVVVPVDTTGTAPEPDEADSVAVEPVAGPDSTVVSAEEAPAEQVSSPEEPSSEEPSPEEPSSEEQESPASEGETPETPATPTSEESEEASQEQTEDENNEEGKEADDEA